MAAKQSRSASFSDEPILNEPQHRHFEVFLSMLEAALDEVERLAKPAESPGRASLVVYDADLPGDFGTRAERQIQRIREEIWALADTLDLKRTHRSRMRAVRALLTAELLRTEDSYARKLRGYGSVDPRVETEIDPALDRIRAELTDLLQACGRETARSTRDGVQ